MDVTYDIVEYATDRKRVVAEKGIGNANNAVALTCKHGAWRRENNEKKGKVKPHSVLKFQSKKSGRALGGNKRMARRSK